MNNNFLQNKQLLTLMAIATTLVLFIITVSVFLFLRPSTPSEQVQAPFVTPTPFASLPQAVTAGKVSPIQKTVINETVAEEVDRFPDLISKEESTDNKTIYTLQSSFASRENVVITQNGVVVFERILTPVKSSAPGFAEISEYTAIFGEPEEMIRGSHHYGPFIYTHIYASQGLAVIGNRVTDEVFEIHNFTPVSIEEYIQEYGDDIDENAPDRIR